jgi:hypothetical protein
MLTRRATRPGGQFNMRSVRLVPSLRDVRERWLPLGFSRLPFVSPPGSYRALTNRWWHATNKDPTNVRLLWT